MKVIDKIKEADAQDDLPGVMLYLGDLLRADFDRSIKSAMEGAKSFLKGGVFSSRYESTFWTSELPMKFGERFASHPVYARRFWGSLFRRAEDELPLLKEFAWTCPDALEDGVRRHRVFFKDVWPLVCSVLKENGLTSFADDCETIRTLKQDSESRLEQFDPLLSKISAEALVVHFGVWLEKRYFEAADDRWFRVKLNEYIEVLQEGLKRLRNIQGPPAQGEMQVVEIQKLITDTCSRLHKSPDAVFDSEPIFESLDDMLSVGHVVEMFSSHGWMLHRSPLGIQVRARDRDQEDAWNANKEKFHAMDIFETCIPFTEDEWKHMTACMQNAPNPLSGNTLWLTYTSGTRFIAKHCGPEAPKLAEKKMGFSVEEAIRVLMANQACYESIFVEPRALAKKRGKPFVDSFAINLTPSEVAATMRGEKTLLRSIPVQPRPFEDFVQLAGTFPETADIPAERVGSIYTHIAQDVWSQEIDLKNKLLLHNRHCNLLLPRIFSADIKSIFFNYLFDSFPNEIASRLEWRVEGIFGWRSFKTICNQKLGSEGEVDVLAYRDSTLFVVETKATRIRATSSQIWPVRESLSKGATQLERVLEVLPKHWGSIHQHLEAPEDLGKLQIITMLVSNSMEFDHLYFGDHLKVSEFELEMVFANNPAVICTLRAQHSLQFAPEEIDSATLVRYMAGLSDGEIEQFAVYNPEGSTVDELIACIEESRFWAKVLGRKMALTPLAKK